LAGGRRRWPVWVGWGAYGGGVLEAGGDQGSLQGGPGGRRAGVGREPGGSQGRFGWELSRLDGGLMAILGRIGTSWTRVGCELITSRAGAGRE
jgi:hypothetical protein